MTASSSDDATGTSEVGQDDPKPTVDTGAAGTGASPDTQSDPSLDDTTGGEWADEGGALPEGPATDTDDGRPGDTVSP